uniref:Putative secreted protein n=1 Tax=Anopheles marajoara TaxID=58244 RepID=A0A2M4CA77_9DIPT
MLCFSNLIVPSVVCSVCRMAFSISVQLFLGIHSRKKSGKNVELSGRTMITQPFRFPFCISAVAPDVADRGHFGGILRQRNRTPVPPVVD